MNLFNIFLSDAQIFLLIAFRVTAIFLTAPIFGSANIPSRIKIGFAFIICFILYPIIDKNFILPTDALMFSFLILKQVFLGAIIGYATYLVFAGIQLSGQIVDLQMGFGIVNVLDPMSNLQVSIMGQFEFLIGVLIFLSINGHHLLIQAIADSFKLTPIVNVGITNITLEKLTDLFFNMFLIALKIAGPATVALFLTNIALGFIARTIPQMNVFIVGLPINILIGIAAIMISLPILVNMFNGLLNSMWTDIYVLIKSMKV